MRMYNPLREQKAETLETLVEALQSATTVGCGLFGGRDGVTDANSQVTNGVYRTGDASTNVISKNGVLLVFAVTSDVVLQINAPYDGSAIYTRMKWFTNWYPWKKITPSST